MGDSSALLPSVAPTRLHHHKIDAPSVGTTRALQRDVHHLIVGSQFHLSELRLPPDHPFGVKPPGGTIHEGKVDVPEKATPPPCNLDTHCNARHVQSALTAPQGTINRLSGAIFIIDTHQGYFCLWGTQEQCRWQDASREQGASGTSTSADEAEEPLPIRGPVSIKRKDSTGRPGMIHHENNLSRTVLPIVTI